MLPATNQSINLFSLLQVECRNTVGYCGMQSGSNCRRHNTNVFVLNVYLFRC